MTKALLRPESSSLEDFLTRAQPQLRGILRRYHIPRADAEDLVQQTLVALVYRWQNVRVPERWVAGTLRQHCLMYWRSRRRSRFVGMDDDTLEWLARPLEAPQVRGELLHDLERAYARLSPHCRSVLRLRYALGFEPPEIARRLGYQRSSISKVTSRCLLALGREIRDLAQRSKSGDDIDPVAE